MEEGVCVKLMIVEWLDDGAVSPGTLRDVRFVEIADLTVSLQVDVIAATRSSS